MKALEYILLGEHILGIYLIQGWRHIIRCIAFAAPNMYGRWVFSMQNAQQLLAVTDIEPGFQQLYDCQSNAE